MDEKKKKRRITGESYWKLRGLQKKIEDGNRALQKWREKELEKLKLYPDQVNWATGAIYDPLVKIEGDKIISATVIGRISLELLKEHRDRVAALEPHAVQLVEIRDQLAKRMGVWPDSISLRDGNVDDDGFEAVDPDAPEKAPAEEAKTATEG